MSFLHTPSIQIQYYNITRNINVIVLSSMRRAYENVTYCF